MALIQLSMLLYSWLRFNSQCFCTESTKALTVIQYHIYIKGYKLLYHFSVGKAHKTKMLNSHHDFCRKNKATLAVQGTIYAKINKSLLDKMKTIIDSSINEKASP